MYLTALMQVTRLGCEIPRSKECPTNPLMNNFNPFPNKPWFLRVCCTSLLKILREKEKFLLFPQCFLPFLKTFTFTINIISRF